MKLKLGIISMIIFSGYCLGFTPGQIISQGLSGTIYLQRGNQMPSPGRPISKGRGVSRDIYVYEPTTIKNTTGTSPVFTQIQTRLVAHTKSDSTGHYSVKLPVGKYSILIAEGKQFFAAESDDTGTLNPVEITLHAVIYKNFTISVNATY